MVNFAHFIWFQGIDKTPEKYKYSINKFKEYNPQFQIRIWSEIELKELLNNTDNNIFSYCIERCNHFIQKVDIYKWLILYQIGGLYLDMDISVHKPIDNTIMDYFNRNDLVLNYMQVWQFIPFKVVNNGIIWCKKNNKLIPKFLETIPWDNQYFKNKDWQILDTTGPFHLSRWVNSMKGHGIIILEPHYFEGRPLVYIKDQQGIYTTHLHHSNWMENWVYMYVFLLKNIFFIIGIIIGYVLINRFYLKWK
jgi:mannosyltransferase OCH1-like enzyme